MGRLVAAMIIRVYILQILIETNPFGSIDPNGIGDLRHHALLQQTGMEMSRVKYNQFNFGYISLPIPKLQRTKG